MVPLYHQSTKHCATPWSAFLPARPITTTDVATRTKRVRLRVINTKTMTDAAALRQSRDGETQSAQGLDRNEMMSSAIEQVPQRYQIKQKSRTNNILTSVYCSCIMHVCIQYKRPGKFSRMPRGTYAG